jgi:hypothetical protein
MKAEERVKQVYPPEKYDTRLVTKNGVFVAVIGGCFPICGDMPLQYIGFASGKKVSYRRRWQEAWADARRNIQTTLDMLYEETSL